MKHMKELVVLLLAAVMVSMLMVYNNPSFYTSFAISAENIMHRITNTTLKLRSPPPAFVEPVLREPDMNSSKYSQDEWRTILFWTSWFSGKWKNRFGPDEPLELKQLKCPSWKCHFTENRSLAHTADAIVFRSGAFSPKSQPHPPRPLHQRWVWVNVEAPLTSVGYMDTEVLHRHNLSPRINWTMTYHRQADVVAFYGYFLSIGATVRPLQPNLMSAHKEALAKYRTALERGDTLEHVMGASWAAFVTRPKAVAWMSSHCSTVSKREAYVAELEKYIPVAKYGRCGSRRCHSPGPLAEQCWTDEMKPNYKFYLSMENNLCDDYITEKLYNPLVFGLVPVVYGGANYDDYLPPHSYINARHYHPRELAKLLTRLHEDPVAYGRYHLWRGYMIAHVRGSLCELCHRLHTPAPPSHHHDIPTWYKKSGHCIKVPVNLFTDKARPDLWKKVILNKTVT